MNPHGIGGNKIGRGPALSDIWHPIPWILESERRAVRLAHSCLRPDAKASVNVKGYQQQGRSGTDQAAYIWKLKSLGTQPQAGDFPRPRTWRLMVRSHDFLNPFGTRGNNFQSYLLSQRRTRRQFTSSDVASFLPLSLDIDQTISYVFKQRWQIFTQGA